MKMNITDKKTVTEYEAYCLGELIAIAKERFYKKYGYGYLLNLCINLDKTLEENKKIIVQVLKSSVKEKRRVDLALEINKKV